MKRWHLPLLVLTLTLFFRYGTSTSVLSAAEIDGLVAGSDLKEGVERGDSLRQTFATHEDHPRAKKLRSIKGGKVQDRIRRANLLTSPLVRWVVGGSMIMVGGDALSAARWAAALAMAFAIGLVCFFLLAGSTRWWFLGLCIATSAVWSSATAAGSASLSCLVITFFLIALKWMRKGRTPLWLGAAWGLTLAIHPATVWFLIPIFIVGAMAYRAEDDVKPSPRPGRLRLPEVPVTLFAVPVVAIALLTAIWPMLWKDTFGGLFFWITEAWREIAAGQVIAGTSFEQTIDRAPLAWSALLQWSSLLPLSVLGMWCIGCWSRVKHDSRGDWDALLVVVTLLLAGAVNGGLFGGRMSLFALLLIPTLLTAARGVDMGWRRIERAWTEKSERLSSRQSLAVVAFLVFGSAALQGLTGTTNLGSSNGLDTDIPLPYALLEDVMEADEGGVGPVPVMLVGGDTLSRGGKDRWKHAFWTVSRKTALDVSIRTPATSRWLLVVDAEPVDIPDEAVYLIPDGDPVFTRVVSGVRWDAYRL